MDRPTPTTPPDAHLAGHDIEIVEFFAWIAVGITVWILALLAVGYWVAGAAPIGGAYIHGMLVGMLLGIVLILTVITQRKDTHQ